LRLHLDIETYSEVDLKAAGVYRYAEHESTELLCFAYAFDDGPVELWTPGRELPTEVIAHIAAGKELRAHSAQFERVVLNGVAGRKLGFPPIKIEQCVCTAAKMAAHGLPRDLAGAAKALGAVEKSGEGRITMLQLSKPRKKHPEGRYTPANSPEKFKILYDYNKQDVESERSIDRLVPDLSPAEQLVYELDQRINDRGIKVDLESIENILAVVDEYKAYLAEECVKLTGANPTQREKIAEWVRTNGYAELTDMQAETVKEIVSAGEAPEPVERALKIYSTYNMKAVTKYDAILAAMCKDERLRGMFLYHGAGTGRWSSQIVQLQNLFRPVIEDPESAMEAFRARSLSWIRDLYPGVDPMKVASSCVRSVLVSGKGKDFIFPDYAGIEARVNAWLFGEKWKLEAFRLFDEGKGPDLYKLAYARAFHVNPARVNKKDRAVGKVLELAMGYEGGASAFVTMAANHGVDLAEMADAVLPFIDEEIRESAEWMWQTLPQYRAGLPHDQFIACDSLKRMWRAIHPKIVQGWKDLKEAADLAVKYSGKTYVIPNKKIMFKVVDKWLYMRLPSGRRIAYFDPKWVETEMDAGLRYSGIDTYTRQWMELETYGGKLCLAEGTEVLTLSGWRAIELCTTQDAVWDGESWVYSGGLVDQGVRDVISYAGVFMTPDHEVLTDEGWKEAVVAQSEGLNRAQIRLPNNLGVFAQRKGKDLLAGAVPMWKNGYLGGSGVNSSTRAKSEILWMQNWQIDRRKINNSRDVPAPYLSRLAKYACSLYTSVAQGMAQLRGAWDTGLQSLATFREFCRGYASRIPVRIDSRSHKQRERVFQTELPMGDAERTRPQYPNECGNTHAEGGYGCESGGGNFRNQKNYAVRAHPTTVARGKVARTYDLINAGPLKRFTVRGETGEIFLVHNCENAVQATARDLLVHGMYRLEERGYSVVGSVHDEVITEVSQDFGSFEEAGRLMCELPRWAAGLPVAVDGHRGRRYRK
jgi:DNA polymerase